MDLVHDHITRHILTAMSIHSQTPPFTEKRDVDGRPDMEAGDTTVHHAEYPSYAVPDTHVLEALLFYTPPRVHNIIDEIRVGHQKLTKQNKVDEFKKINIIVPAGYNLLLLNDPVYHFCVSIRKLKSFHLPGVNATCFSKSATANSGNNPAPYVACMLMGSQCKHWTNIGIGIEEGKTTVTGVGHVRVHNDSIVYNRLADRNRDSPDSWVHECKSMYQQSLHLLGAEKGFDVGFSYDCASQVFKKRTGVDASKETRGQGTLQTSWGDHEAWNEVLQVSEMAACLHTIKTGGNFLLKVRIFHNPETQFAVAALANFFDKMEIVAVPQQRCCFVIAYFTGKKSMSPEILESGTHYFLSECADSTLRVFSPPECCKPSKESLKLVMDAALEMKVYKDNSFHYFSMAVRALLKDRNLENVFMNTNGRISGVKNQVSLTDRLRNAISPHTHGHGAHENAEASWIQFLQDMG